MKERSVFFTEAKISLPIYKVVYSAFFTVVLSIIRGVSFTNEIGGTLESQMDFLLLSSAPILMHRRLLPEDGRSIGCIHWRTKWT